MMRTGDDMRAYILAIALLAASAPAFGQNIANTSSYSYLKSLPVPVVEGDITDRPYRVVGHITKGIRKATVFSKAASYDKVMRELWESARKMGADAVVNAQFGEARKQAFSSWGTREARGMAIKFLTDAEIAAMAPQKEVEPPRTVQLPKLAETPGQEARPAVDTADKFEKLARLRKDGMISEEQYEAALTYYRANP